MNKAIDFVKTNRFWIGVGLLALVGVAAFGAGYLPSVQATQEKKTELQQMVQSLQQYAAQDLHNQQDIQGVRQLQDYYRQQLQEVRQTLESRDAAIEKQFEEPGREGQGPLEASVWKMVYNDKTRALEEKVQQFFVAAPTDLVIRQEYVTELPSQQEMREEEKYFWVQKYAIDALADLNASSAEPVVPVLNGFSFVEAPERLLNRSHREEFEPIPFEFSFSAEFKNIPRVMSSLLSSPANFQITSLETVRPDKLDRKVTKQGGDLEVEAGFADRRREQQRERRPRERRAERRARPSQRGVPEGIPTGPPEGIPMGPPEGVPMGPPEGFDPSQFIPDYAEGGGMMPGTQRREEDEERDRERRRRASRRSRETAPIELTEEERAQLPKGLVDVTIKGYVADFVGAQEQQQQQQQQQQPTG